MDSDEKNAFEGFTYNDGSVDVAQPTPPREKIPPRPKIDKEAKREAWIQENLKILSSSPKLILGRVGFGGSVTDELSAFNYCVENVPFSRWVVLAMDPGATTMMRAYCASAIGKLQIKKSNVEEIHPLLEASFGWAGSISTQSGCIVSGDTISNHVMSSFIRGCADDDLREELATHVLTHVSSGAGQRMNNENLAIIFNQCLPYIKNPESFDLVEKLTTLAAPLCRGTLIRTKLRLNPNLYDSPEVRSFIADLEEDKIEIARDLSAAIAVFALHPEKDLLIKLLFRCAENGGYGPLLHELPLIVPVLLHEDTVAAAAVACHEQYGQARGLSFFQYFWKFLSPDALKIPKQTSLSGTILKWLMDQTNEVQMKLLQSAESVVPDAVLQTFRQRLAQKRNFLYIVEQIWRRFQYATNANLELLFNNRSEEEIPTDFIKTETLKALQDHNQAQYTGACLKALHKRLSTQEWDEFFPKALSHLSLYNSVALLKMVSADNDFHNIALVEALFTAFASTDNGHLLNPIADAILSFRRKNLYDRLQELLNQQIRAKRLDSSSWGVQNLYESLARYASK